MRGPRHAGVDHRVRAVGREVLGQFGHSLRVAAQLLGHHGLGPVTPRPRHQLGRELPRVDLTVVDDREPARAQLARPREQHLGHAQVAGGKPQEGALVGRVVAGGSSLRPPRRHRRQAGQAVARRHLEDSLLVRGRDRHGRRPVVEVAEIRDRGGVVGRSLGIGAHQRRLPHPRPGAGGVELDQPYAPPRGAPARVAQRQARARGDGASARGGRAVLRQARVDRERVPGDLRLLLALAAAGAAAAPSRARARGDGRARRYGDERCASAFSTAEVTARG